MSANTGSRQSASPGTQPEGQERSSTWGCLPLDVLAKVLNQIDSDYLPGAQPSLSWQTARTLIRCSAVSRHWRAGVELAVQSVHFLDLYELPPLFCSPVMVSWGRHFTRLNLDVTSLDEAGLCSFVRACSQLDELDVMSFHDAILAGACMDVALAGNRTLTKYGCRGYMPATLPCSLQHIRVELGDDTGASEAAQLLIRLWQCPKLQTISFEAHRCSEAPLELSKKRLYHLALLPSLQSFRLTIHAKTGSFVDVSWLQLPRSFAVQLEYDEGGWDGSVDWEGTPSPIEEIRGHWLHEAAQLQPQDSFKASFTVFAALSPADRQALSQLRPARCRLTLPPQLLSVLPRCRVVDLCFGFCREDKVPATTGQAELTWAALTASPVRINVSFERWARPQLRVTGCPPDSDAPSFAEPWLLCVRGSCLLEGLPPGARAEQDCYLLQNAAARKAGL